MKVKTYPKQEFRRRNKDFVKRNWASLLLIVGIGATAGSITWFAWSGSARAFVLGAWTVGIAWALWACILFASGSINLRFGVWGERFTRDEFKKLRKHGWTFVQGIRLGHGDVDCVAFSPAGVFAVEAKWISDRPKDKYVARDRSSHAWQAGRNAAGIKDRLEELSVKTHVQPVVVLWGPGAVAPKPVGSLHDGVPILHGLDLTQWLRGRPESIDQQTVQVVKEKLAEILATQGPLELRNDF